MMVKLEKLNTSNVEKVNNLMEEYNTNCISLVNHRPVVLLNLNEFEVTKIIKADTIYFKCVSVLDATNVCIVEMDCTIMVGGFNSLLNAIILYKSSNSLIEEEKTIRLKIYNRFKVLLQANENRICSENDFCIISKYFLLEKIKETFNFNSIWITNDREIVVFDLKTNSFVDLFSLPLKVQIKLYDFFCDVVEKQLLDNERNCMIGHC